MTATQQILDIQVRTDDLKKGDTIAKLPSAVVLLNL